MLYDNVKLFADKRGLSIMAVEKKAGLGNGAIGKWRDATPNVNAVKKVADVLNVKVDTLLK